MSFVAGKGRGLLGRNQVLDRIGCNSVGAVTNPPSPTSTSFQAFEA